MVKALFVAVRLQLSSKSQINPILHGGGGSNRPPWLIIVRLSSGDTLNGLIFHDFVPFNIRKVLGRTFLKFLFEISKIF